MGVFAQAYNRIYGHWGHVWGDRFYSAIIHSRAVFRLVKDYIEDNPVVAGLVEAAQDWPWSSLWTETRSLPQKP